MTDHDTARSVDPAETSETPTTPSLRPWLCPQVRDLDIGKATTNGGPTYLDTGAFDNTQGS